MNEISFGLGGAIPADLAKSVFDAIKRDGRVRRSWTRRRSAAARRPAQHGPGALVVVGGAAGRLPRRPACKTGDLLVRVNGSAGGRQVRRATAGRQSTAARSVDRPSRRRSSSRRDGKDVTINVTPLERPVASSMPAELRAWGIVGAESFRLRSARDGPREPPTASAIVEPAPGRPGRSGEAVRCRPQRHHRRDRRKAGAPR